MTKIPEEHTAARALEDSFRKLGEERARAQAPQRARRRTRRRVPRIVLIALTALLLAAVAATGAKVFLDDDGSLSPDPKGPKSHLAPGSSDGRLALASAADPVERRPWGLRLSERADGDTCLALGRVVGGRLGTVRQGRFTELPTRAADLCAPLEARHVVAATRSSSDAVVAGGRAVLFGIADRTITRVELRPATGRPSAVPVKADGTFVVVRRGRDALRRAQLVVDGATGTRTIVLDRR